VKAYRCLVTFFNILLISLFAQAERASELRSVIFDNSLYDQKESNASTLLTRDCNVDGKIQNINQRYLTPSSSIVATDFRTRTWAIDRLFRDYFKIGTNLPQSTFSEDCLKQILRVAIKETTFHAQTLNTDNRCYANLEALSKINRNERPEKCPEEAWAQAMTLRQILQTLDTSVSSQQADIERLNRQVETTQAAAPSQCLDCLSESIARSATLSQNQTDLEDIRYGACCSLLKEQKIVENSNQCESKLNPDASISYSDSIDCVKNIGSGILQGLEALNPLEIIAALPEISELLKHLVNGQDRSGTLKSILLGVLKGATGFDENLWSCYNSKSKITYGCQILGHSSTVFVGSAAIFKILRLLKNGAISVSRISGIADKISESQLYGQLLEKTLKLRDYKLFSSVISAEDIQKYSDMVKKSIGDNFDSLAASNPATVGRLKDYLDALKDAREAAQEIVKIDLNLKQAERAGQDVSKLMADKEAALKVFEETQKSLAVRIELARKASLLAIVREASRTAPTGLSDAAEDRKARISEEIVDDPPSTPEP
jgi:hypothetical protein